MYDRKTLQNVRLVINSLSVTPCQPFHSRVTTLPLSQAV